MFTSLLNAVLHETSCDQDWTAENRATVARIVQVLDDNVAPALAGTRAQRPETNPSHHAKGSIHDD